MKVNMSNGGKGSARRPTDSKKFADNWDLIFGKKTDEKTNSQTQTKAS